MSLGARRARTLALWAPLDFFSSSAPPVRLDGRRGGRVLLACVRRVLREKAELWLLER